MVKLCSKCKNPGVFSPDKRASDGLQSHCRSCCNIYQKNSTPCRKTKEQRSKHDKKWRLLNPGKKAAHIAKRHAAKLKATPKWLTTEHLKEIEQFYIEAKELQWLSNEPLHVDHIRPLQGKNECGLHVPWNLQILPKSMNSAKGNRV